MLYPRISLAADALIAAPGGLRPFRERQSISQAIHGGRRDVFRAGRRAAEWLAARGCVSGKARTVEVWLDREVRRLAEGLRVRVTCTFADASAAPEGTIECW